MGGTGPREGWGVMPYESGSDPEIIVQLTVFIGEGGGRFVFHSVMTHRYKQLLKSSAGFTSFQYPFSFSIS